MSKKIGLHHRDNIDTNPLPPSSKVREEQENIPFALAILIRDEIAIPFSQHKYPDLYHVLPTSLQNIGRQLECLIADDTPDSDQIFADLLVDYLSACSALLSEQGTQYLVSSRGYIVLGYLKILAEYAVGGKRIKLLYSISAQACTNITHAE